MILYKNGTDLNAFKKGKEIIESGAHIYIDVFRDDIAKGKIEIIYGFKKLDELINFEDCISTIRPNSLLIGKGRGRNHYTNLETHPHLLIAGVSGSGKSTFLRSLIFTLIQNNQDYRITVLDLKGGLEFKHLLEGVRKTTVKSEIDGAVAFLESLNVNLDLRMKFLESKKLTDISKYFRSTPLESRVKENSDFAFREVVVIDECAELFLHGGNTRAEHVKKAKETLSRISRLGRAVGIHLILATQRPDRNAVDPQVKANLSGVICFRTANLPTSMTILGNARATELPAEIKGRAIWKSDGDYYEVQTPLISPELMRSIITDSKDLTAKVETASPSKVNKISKTENGDLSPKEDEAWQESL